MQIESARPPVLGGVRGHVGAVARSIFATTLSPIPEANLVDAELHRREVEVHDRELRSAGRLRGSRGRSS
jgi:hypothetical protein